MTHSSFVSLLAISGVLFALSACGDDDDADSSKGSGGSGASSGGSQAGGKAGSASGGANGEAGSASGGTTSEGGAGGAGGGASELAELCEKTCADQAPLACAFKDDACATSCNALPQDLEAPNQYLAMLRCQAENLGPADYTCLAMDPDPVIWPAPVADTSCEPQICAWYCRESTLWGNSAVYYRCDC